MTELHNKAVLVLRILDEMKAYLPKKAKLQEVLETAGWSLDEHRPIDLYLGEKGWIEGQGTINLSITPSGADALKAALENRMQLSILAERIAYWLCENEPLGGIISYSQIMKELDIDTEQYARAIHDLWALGLVEKAELLRAYGEPEFAWPKLTRSGALAVKSNFVQPNIPTVAQQIGVQINAPVNQSPIAGIVDSQDTTVNQAIEGADLAQLAEIGAIYLDEIIDLVKNELHGSQLSAYISATQELKKSLAAQQPDHNRLKKLISIVAFLDTANGAIDLGAKGLELASKVLPNLHVLIQVINRFASSL